MSARDACEVAWAAGLFEGEGSFWVQHATATNVRIGASLTSTDTDVLATFHRVVGVGGIGQPRTDPRGRRKTSWTWQATGKDAESVYTLFASYLHSRRREQWARVAEERADYEQRLPMIRSEGAHKTWAKRRLPL